MREIKFRAWVGEKTQYLVLLDELHHCCECGNVKDNEVVNKSDILMQYTDLEDRDGRAIWEGDIVEYEDKTVLRRCIVEWATSYGQWSLHYTDKDKRGEIEHTQKIRPIFWNTLARVSGNIYENPELLGSAPTTTS